MLDDRTDALFPLPESSAGKLLKHLVVRQIPGTPIEARAGDVARGAGLRPADATAALAKLADDGLILVEPGIAADAFTVTVLLAPPLEEYGITPEWAENGAPVTAIPPAVPASRTDGRATPSTTRLAPRGDGAPRGDSTARRSATTSAGQRANAAPSHTAPRGQDVSDQARATPAAATTPAPPPAARQAAPPTQAPRRGSAAAPAREPGGRRGPAPKSVPPAAQTLPLPETTAPSAPAAAEAQRPDASASTAPTGSRGSRGSLGNQGRASGGRRPSEGGATVDETALVRGFVERFERLLAEMDEWKRRAQQAEDRATAAEKRIQAAERRATTAETRLAEAQERLSTWADLTRRMQQLSRQADGGARSRATSTRGAHGTGGARGAAEDRKS